MEQQSETMDSENSTKKQPKKRNHHIRCCVLLSLTLIVIFIAIIIALAFTVYKIRDPTMTFNSVRFESVDLTKNTTVVTDVSVKNPNALDFRFDSSTTSFIYRGKEVGVAVGPPGTVKARRTSRTNVTVEVITARLVSDAKFLKEVMGGSLGLQSCTVVGGRVKVLGLFRRHVDLMFNCSINVSIAGQEILDQLCTSRIWI